ncbi:MAG: type II toxin-antitoxin system RelE/ParE family toxin [Pyrinomonadaceae bacterium]|nr:type II toxin-antitoxin system RelE/ParE family toxin [Pyrinomonadaceae bacterium]
MPQILFTPIASDDLVEIWTFIAAESDEQIADGFLDRIKEKCEAAARSPLAFPERSQILPAVRICPFRRYVIFYFVIEDGIEVLRVLHSARDTEALFELDDDG